MALIMSLGSAYLSCLLKSFLPIEHSRSTERSEHFIKACCDRTKGFGKFRLDIRKKCCTVGEVRYRFLENLWMPCPWKCSRQIGQGFEQTGLVKVSLPMRHPKAVISEVSYNPNCAIQFCELVFNIKNL